ncbi:hypothetical protein OTK51_21040 [Vibrio scophthalmi]|uniref:hypothetical protein n=1 Tax=Vibrio scophthalmi TaxID=45658 RepID=UPI002283A286|nr:hypothetical protein [Vibrio scophthalmi]MCY9805914.1 hypothetical protein [Vibrio scophthalmi]
MKFYLWLIVLGILSLLVLSILPFLNIPVLETNTSFIGAYGSYLSGTAGPLISALAFVALLKTLHLQQKQLQQQSIDSEQRSLLIILEKTEADLDKCLNRHNITFEFEGNNYGYSEILRLEFFGAFYENHVPKKDEKAKGEKQWQTLMGQELMQSADLHLLRLAAVVRRYDILSGDNIMFLYYRGKYATLLDRLNQLGYLYDKNQRYWLEQA